MLYILLVLIMLLWVMAGISAFIASIICLFYNSSTSSKFIGFILAFFFGPFFWIYYIYNVDYCTK